MSTPRSRLPAFAVALAIVAALLLGAEITFRVVAGERLLYRADGPVEYAPQPNQSVIQRGVHIETNELGMRSPAIAREKPADVFRVLVLGDSVVFGHTNINQVDLATTLLSVETLGDGRKIEVLNVSSPSWGPGNLLAWIETNGLLGADTAIIVLSTHDLEDDRTFTPPNPAIYPKDHPLIALADWIARRLTASEANEDSSDPRSPGDARRSLPALFGKASGAPAGACLVIHSTINELISPTPSADAGELRDIAIEADLDVVHASNLIDTTDYLDGIHLSAQGQASLAKAMMTCPALAGGRMRG